VRGRALCHACLETRHAALRLLLFHRLHHAAEFRELKKSLREGIYMCVREKLG
jgi:hypothetical protein